jgi:hypothetical protein
MAALVGFAGLLATLPTSCIALVVGKSDERQLLFLLFGGFLLLASGAERLAERLRGPTNRWFERGYAALVVLITLATVAVVVRDVPLLDSQERTPWWRGAVAAVPAGTLVAVVARAVIESREYPVFLTILALVATAPLVVPATVSGDAWIAMFDVIGAILIAFWFAVAALFRRRPPRRISLETVLGTVAAGALLGVGRLWGGWLLADAAADSGGMSTLRLGVLLVAWWLFLLGPTAIERLLVPMSLLDPSRPEPGGVDAARVPDVAEGGAAEISEGRDHRG